MLSSKPSVIIIIIILIYNFYIFNNLDWMWNHFCVFVPFFVQSFSFCLITF